MSIDQNRVSPDSPTACTISGQVMHWDGRRWTHPAAQGCNLETHLSGYPVTAPELVEIVTEVLAAHDSVELLGNYWRCSCDANLGVRFLDNLHTEHQARAVLDALTKAGNVEWASRNHGSGMVFRCNSQEEAERETARFPYHRATVSRLTFPWTAAE